MDTTTELVVNITGSLLSTVTRNCSVSSTIASSIIPTSTQCSSVVGENTSSVTVCVKSSPAVINGKKYHRTASLLLSVCLANLQLRFLKWKDLLLHFFVGYHQQL